MEGSSSLEWQALAKCRNAPPEFFQPDEQHRHFEGKNAYRRFCDICEVTAQCEEHAILYGYPGIWGGLTEHERKVKYQKNNRRALLIEDAEDSGKFNNRLRYNA
jgi:hypothetical protein